MEQLQLHELRNACPLHALHLLFPLESSRKKRNRETCWRQSKKLKRVQREAKRELVAQPEISHEAAVAVLKSPAGRTDEKFPGIIHVSHQLALLHGHENVFSAHNAVLSTLVDH